eukprot:jgi/Chlat1/4268/Chrsp29S04374
MEVLERGSLAQSTLWRDVEPLPQDDGPHPVVSIAYTEEFQQTMDYFRAIVAREEFSERALQLTARVISLNAANYTGWWYRRRCLEELNANLEDELNYIDSLVQDNQKNYQLWYHRRVIASRVGPSVGHRELELTEAVLDLDSKNYHAWSHRQWAVKEFGLWEGELNFCDHLLKVVVRNNSAWNHRHFVITNGPVERRMHAVRDAELAYAADCIRQAPNNESAWNYLRGVMMSSGARFGDEPVVRLLCAEIIAAGVECPQAWGMQLEVCLDQMALASGDITSQERNAIIATAQQICDRLALVDPTRVRYWKYRQRQITGLMA